MKEKIVSFFKTDRSYSGAKALYFRYGKNRSFMNSLNRQVENVQLKSMLFEELRKLADLNERTFKKMLAQRIEVPAADAKNPSQKKAPHKSQASTADMNSIPDYIKKTIKLREEFPFLKEKSCPEEFKILVADMLTAYDNYKKAHAGLFKKITLEKLEELSKSVVDNYLENRAIWEELSYYKDKGEILGDHPIFQERKWKERYGSMNSNDLHNELDRLYGNIKRNEKKIADDPESEHTADRQERIELYSAEYNYVKKLLGIE